MLHTTRTRQGENPRSSDESSRAVEDHLLKKRAFEGTFPQWMSSGKSKTRYPGVRLRWRGTAKEYVSLSSHSPLSVTGGLSLTSNTTTTIQVQAPSVHYLHSMYRYLPSSSHACVPISTRNVPPPPVQRPKWLAYLDQHGIKPRRATRASFQNAPRGRRVLNPSILPSSTDDDCV